MFTSRNSEKLRVAIKKNSKHLWSAVALLPLSQ